MRSVTYLDMSENPNTAARSISFPFSDGYATSNTSSTDRVAVVPVNNPPTVTMPAAQALDENTPFSFAAGAMSVSDVDA